jgi:hypothetical protein
MANRRAGQTGTRKLTKLGKGSIGLTLPKGLVKSLHWREKQKVKVKKVKGALVVRDAPTSHKLRGARKTKKRRKK